MEGAMMLLLFSAFLVIVIYRMDQNEKQSKKDDKSIYEAGFRDGMMRSPESFEEWRDRGAKIKSIMKRKK